MNENTQTIPKMTAEDLLEQADTSLRKQIARSMVNSMYEDAPFSDWGVLVQYHKDGKAQLGLAPPRQDWDLSKLLSADVPAILSSWMPLRLEFADAKALPAELFRLIGKYSQKQGSQSYLLGLALAPTEVH